MREFRTSGSVRGAPSNERPYRDYGTRRVSGVPSAYRFEAGNQAETQPMLVFGEPVGAAATHHIAKPTTQKARRPSRGGRLFQAQLGEWLNLHVAMDACQETR